VLQKNIPEVPNRMFALLPGAKVHAETVMLEQGDVIFEPGIVQDYAYFPAGAVLALFGVVEGTDRGMGLGLIGPEGMAGIGLALGAANVFTRIIVQSRGPALRMHVADVRDFLIKFPQAQWRFFQHAYVSMMQARQVAVCSNFHETLPRLVRWLLLTRDRAGTCEIALTQEYLARMLGVRRASVTEAAGALQYRNLIHYCRGRIKILDERGLESACCTCYRTISRVERANGLASLHAVAVPADQFPLDQVSSQLS
jgi:CRP-like cAMP-binding protein